MVVSGWSTSQVVSGWCLNWLSTSQVVSGLSSNTSKCGDSQQPVGRRTTHGSAIGTNGLCLPILPKPKRLDFVRPMSAAVQCPCAPVRTKTTTSPITTLPSGPVPPCVPRDLLKRPPLTSPETSDVPAPRRLRHHHNSPPRLIGRMVITGSCCIACRRTTGRPYPQIGRPLPP